MKSPCPKNNAGLALSVLTLRGLLVSATGTCAAPAKGNVTATITAQSQVPKREVVLGCFMVLGYDFCSSRGDFERLQKAHVLLSPTQLWTRAAPLPGFPGQPRMCNDSRNLRSLGSDLSGVSASRCARPMVASSFKTMSYPGRAPRRQSPLRCDRIRTPCR